MAEKTDNKNQEDDEPREQDADNLKRMKQVVKNVISNCYANLSESLSGCLSDFANKMLSEQLITDSVMRKADFNEIIGDYKAGISTIFKYTELQGYCSKLLDVLRSLGGPAQRTADYLESELNKSFQEKFGHFLFPQPREVRINSSPSISSCPPTTKRPYASDSNFFKIYISEINPIQDQPSVKNNQITEESTSPDPSCPTITKSSFSVPDSFVSGKSLGTTFDKPTEEDSGVSHTVQSDNLVPDIAMATEKENDEFYLSTSAEETNTNVSCRTDQTIITTNNNKPAAGTNPPSEHLSMVKDKEDNPSYTNGQKELDDLSDGERDGHVKTSCIYVPPGSLLSQLPTQLPQNNKIRSDELQQPYIPITLIQENESIQHQATSDNTGIHKRKQDILATDVIQRECKGYEEVKHDEIYMSISNEISTKKSTLLSTDETIRPYIVIIITILFSFLLCLPYMGKQTLPCKL